MIERGARLDGERRLLQVTDVLRAIEDQFHTAFPRRIWVCGTIRGLHGIGAEHESAGGPAGDAFVLVEDGDDGARTLPCELASDARRAIDDTLRRLHDVAVADLLVEDHYVRAGGLLSYDPERHCAIFGVTALDPQPTAVWLAERRDQVRAAAASAGLADRQRDLRVPEAPASVGLVAAAGDPALGRAERRLASCGFEMDIRVYAPDISGAAAGDQLANGLREAALAGHDIVLLLRQDGRPLSLAPYDSEAVIRAVASSTTPVLTGLGSLDEPAAAEEVAHQAYPSADEATNSVVRRLQRAFDLVESSVDTVVDAGDEALRRAARRLEQTRHLLAEQFRQAVTRAEKARAERVLRIRILAAVIAAGVVGAAVATKIWPLLAALVIPLAIALAAPRLHTRRRAPVSVEQYSFSEGLAQLHAIAQQLGDVSDPDDVLRLEADADAIAEHCRSLLRRPRPLRDRAARASTDATHGLPLVTADGGTVGAAADSDEELNDFYPGAEQPTLDAADSADPAAGDQRHGGSARTLVLPSDPVRSQG